MGPALVFHSCLCSSHTFRSDLLDQEQWYGDKFVKITLFYIRLNHSRHLNFSTYVLLCHAEFENYEPGESDTFLNLFIHKCDNMFSKHVFGQKMNLSRDGVQNKETMFRKPYCHFRLSFAMFFENITKPQREARKCLLDYTIVEIDLVLQ